MLKPNAYEKIDYRPWGHFKQYSTESGITLKEITVLPSKRLSLQSHKLRDEKWIFIGPKFHVELTESRSPLDITTLLSPDPGNVIDIPRGWKHRLENTGTEIGHIIEISFGEFDENDIDRFEDDYGRV